MLEKQETVMTHLLSRLFMHMHHGIIGNFGFLLRGVLPLRLSNYNKFVGCFYMLGDGSSIDKEPNGEGRGLLETSRVAWAGLEYRRSLASHTHIMPSIDLVREGRGLRD